MIVHVPSTVAPRSVEHASHSPAHAELQHTPSEQALDMHSLAAEHLAPFTNPIS